MGQRLPPPRSAPHIPQPGWDWGGRPETEETESIPLDSAGGRGLVQRWSPGAASWASLEAGAWRRAEGPGAETGPCGPASAGGGQALRLVRRDPNRRQASLGGSRVGDEGGVGVRESPEQIWGPLCVPAGRAPQRAPARSRRPLQLGLGAGRPARPARPGPFPAGPGEPACPGHVAPGRSPSADPAGREGRGGKRGGDRTGGERREGRRGGPSGAAGRPGFPAGPRGPGSQSAARLSPAALRSSPPARERPSGPGAPPPSRAGPCRAHPGKLRGRAVEELSSAFSLRRRSRPPAPRRADPAALRSEGAEGCAAAGDSTAVLFPAGPGRAGEDVPEPGAGPGPRPGRLRRLGRLSARARRRPPGVRAARARPLHAALPAGVRAGPPGPRAGRAPRLGAGGRRLLSLRPGQPAPAGRSAARGHRLPLSAQSPGTRRRWRRGDSGAWRLPGRAAGARAVPGPAGAAGGRVLPRCVPRLRERRGGPDLDHQTLRRQRPERPPGPQSHLR